MFKSFTHQVISATNVVAAALLVLLPFQVATSAGESQAFAAKSTQEALAQLGAITVTDSSQVILTTPLLAENAMAIPIIVTSKLPNTEAIAIVLDTNPSPLAAFMTVNGVEPFISAYVKLNRTSNVRAIVKAGGKFYSSTQVVKVTDGGCGGGSFSAKVATDAVGAGATRMRVVARGDQSEMQVLIEHPMETGLRPKNAAGDMVTAVDATTGKPLAPHFINRVSASVNGKAVLEAQWGPSIAANPRFGFRLKDAKKGDAVGVRWSDNLGRAGGVDKTIS